MTSSNRNNSVFSQRVIIVSSIALALVVFIFAWVSITSSRSDSLSLLRDQGASFTQSLAYSAEGALESEAFFDYLIYRRFNALALELIAAEFQLTEDQIMRFGLDHDLYSIHLFQEDSTQLLEAYISGPRTSLKQFVLEEVYGLFTYPENNYVLLYDQGESPGEAAHYYLQLTNDLKHVILLSADANYFTETLRETRIDNLVQKMSREAGVDYIVYQTDSGVVFSSRKVSNLSQIASDPFLEQALQEDSVTSRIVDYAEGKVLELVRPFATPDYQFGAFRVGLSLNRYYNVSRGYDLQMITLSAVLFILIVLLLLYFGSRTKRREISQQLAQVKSISDKIFDEMRTGAAVIDSGGRFVLANRAFQDILGVSDCEGKPVSEFGFGDEISKMLANSSKPGETEISEEVDHQLKWLLISTSMVGLPGESKSGLVAMFYDITRLKQFEREAARKERLSELGDLAAGVAHEIRNPLNTISIAVQRLGNEFKPQEGSEEYLQFVQQIRGETRRLNDIITRFLALARDESDKKAERIDLTGFLQGMISFVSPEAETLAIKLDMRVQDNLEIAIGADQLKQVMSNLFNNAKEALAGKPGVITIGAFVENKTVVIRVADSGPGIKESDYERVLAPYYTTKDAGTGLGLPTVHRIVTASGGELRIGKSKLGGAEIECRFPS
ncbi:MAG: histidine kinase dimerization/phospho-acceptor domain-containing protein [bacterium]|nr:histidine kinase dimerization/phospho-acceptor domain-containing protein [bacterium]